MDKYHVYAKEKGTDRIVWRFTEKGVKKEEAEKVAQDAKKGFNRASFYMSVEKE